MASINAQLFIDDDISRSIMDLDNQLYTKELIWNNRDYKGYLYQQGENSCLFKISLEYPN